MSVNTHGALEWIGIGGWTILTTSSSGLGLSPNNAPGTAFAPRCSVRPAASCPRDLLLGRRVLLLLTTIVACWATVAQACPFCTALPRTVSDDLEESTAAVVACCEAMSAETDGVRICRMRITDVVKGDPALENSVVEVASLRELSGDAVFWLVGYGEARLQWAPPTDISTKSVSYLRGLSGLPERGPRRLEYFLAFLQHVDDFVTADAYNEFAEASLKDIAGLRDKRDRQWVIAQLRALPKDLPAAGRN